MLTSSKNQSSRGLKRLRWYCQMCSKQCSDENSFQCHTRSDVHLRNMQLFRDNSSAYIDEFSAEFERSYFDVLKRKSLNKFISANLVYQELIADKSHIHMNATRWSSLSSFIQYLGKSGKCEVQLVESSNDMWLVKAKSNLAYIGNKTHQTVDSSNTINNIIDKQLNAFKSTQNNNQSHIITPTAIDSTTTNDKIQLSLHSGAQFGKHTTCTTVFNSDNSDSTVAQRDDKRKLSVLDEVIIENENKKHKSAESQLHLSTNQHKTGWLHIDLIVKVINKQLESGKYYKLKAQIIETFDNNRVARCRMLDNDDILRLDQLNLQTVLPNVGKQVMILSGDQAGKNATLISINSDRFTCTVKLSNGFQTQLDYDAVCKFIGHS